MPEAELTTLVVDDHPVVRKGLVALLEGKPWAGRCVQAESVASAKAVAVAERPRLAVVDLRLPDGDGVDVVAALRTLVPECRCLMLTMEANPSLVRRVWKASGLDGPTHLDVTPRWQHSLIWSTGQVSVGPAVAGSGQWLIAADPRAGSWTQTAATDTSGPVTVTLREPTAGAWQAVAVELPAARLHPTGEQAATPGG